MKSYSALILSALAAAAQAVQFTNPAVNPEPGQPFELTWSGAQGSVTINLKGGPSDNLVTVDTLASDISGDSTTITLDPEQLPSGDYAFEIIDSADANNPNYSVQFSFEGSGTATPSPSASASASSSGSPSSTASRSSASTSGTASRTASSSASGTESSSPTRTSDADEEEETVPDSASTRNLSPLALIFVTAAAMMYFN